MVKPDPPATRPTPQSAAWCRRADSLAWQVNLGWCFDQLVWVLPITASVATAVVLYLRTTGAADPWVYLGALLPLLGACLYSWLLARGDFIGRRQALVRLESSLHLDAALSSAAAGVGDWPALPTESSSTLRWRWERSFLPALVSIMLVVVAVLWPLPATLMAQNAPAPKPRNIEALEAILELLKRQPLIAEEDLSTLDREISRLSEESGSLYDPTTLEAADHLAERTSEALSGLADSSALASRALRAATDPPAGARDRAWQAEQIENALKQMMGAAMNTPAGLREALSAAAGNGMRELSPEATRELQELLIRNQELFQEMLEHLAPGQFPKGDGANPGDDQAGAGGPEHGDAPPAALRFHAEERGVDGSRPESLAPDPDAATPGDLIDLRALRPPDPVPVSPLNIESAGRPHHEAGGGARLWQENLNPDEQRFLGEFYR